MTTPSEHIGATAVPVSQATCRGDDSKPRRQDVDQENLSSIVAAEVAKQLAGWGVTLGKSDRQVSQPVTTGCASLPKENDINLAGSMDQPYVSKEFNRVWKFASSEEDDQNLSDSMKRQNERIKVLEDAVKNLSIRLGTLDKQVAKERPNLRDNLNDLKRDAKPMQVQGAGPVPPKGIKTMHKENADLQTIVNEQGHRDEALQEQGQGLDQRHKAPLEEMVPLPKVNMQAELKGPEDELFNHCRLVFEERLAVTESRFRQLFEDMQNSWVVDRQGLQGQLEEVVQQLLAQNAQDTTHRLGACPIQSPQEQGRSPCVFRRNGLPWSTSGSSTMHESFPPAPSSTAS